MRCALQRVVERHLLWQIRHAVPHRIAPFPFVDAVADHFHLSTHAPLQGVLVFFPFAFMRQRQHTSLQGVARVFVKLARAQHTTTGHIALDGLAVGGVRRSAVGRFLA